MQRHDSTGDTQIPQPSMNDAVSDLFQTSVLLLGEEQMAAMVVEEAVAEASIDPCADFDSRSNELVDHVISAALSRMNRETAGALDAPPDHGAPGGCIESDDLSASGVSSVQLQAMVDGPGREKLRQWLDQLSACLRAVFVLRAILGCDNQKTTAMLMKSGAQGWTANQVSLIYRQALCSLATSLVNSTHSRLVS